MTITYPLDLPASGLRDFAFDFEHAQAFMPSPFTFQGQVQEMGGDLWVAQFAPAIGNRQDAAAWQGFLGSLRGMVGTFLLGDPNAVAPRGSVTGSPLVNGAGQTGRALAVDALGANKTGVFLAGDFIQLGSGASSFLHMITKDANSNASGQATLDIWPSLRVSPADNAAITYTNCKGVFMLSTPTGGYAINSNSIYDLSFQAIEVLP